VLRGELTEPWLQLLSRQLPQVQFDGRPDVIVVPR
jgi:hypothetical protein